MPPPPPQTSQYLTILMTGRGGAIICVGFWRPLINAPPSPDATILNYLIMTERGGAIIFSRILTPRNATPTPSPDPTILNNLNDRAMGRHYLCRILASPMHRPPLAPQYCSILMTERGGAIIFCKILAPPIAPPPPQTPQYLTILMTRRGGAIIFV